jgi:serine/threonine protein phosphatase PrpC
METFIDTVKRICEVKITDNHLSLTEREADFTLSNAAERANLAVLAYQKEHSDLGEMGTTLVAAIICRNEEGASVSWINVGDSRIYTVDHRDILQVSRDHSYLQYMIDVGEITPEEAAHCPKNGVITRAIGIYDEAEPDIDTFPLSAEECETTHIYLCSDGFSGALDEAYCMETINDRSRSVREKAERLVADALRKRKAKNKPSLKGYKDMRIFLNTLNHAVDVIRRAGIEADTAKSETDEYFEYVIRISKPDEISTLTVTTQAV